MDRQNVFDYDPDETVKGKTNDVELIVADGCQLHQSTDHWTSDGTTWTRHHVIVRDRLFNPSTTTDGPDPQHLSDRRVTTMTAGLQHKRTQTIGDYVGIPKQITFGTVLQYLRKQHYFRNSL